MDMNTPLPPTLPGVSGGSLPRSLSLFGVGPRGVRRAAPLRREASTAPRAARRRRGTRGWRLRPGGCGGKRAAHGAEWSQGVVKKGL